MMDSVVKADDVLSLALLAKQIVLVQKQGHATQSMHFASISINRESISVKRDILVKKATHVGLEQRVMKDLNAAMMEFVLHPVLMVKKRVHAILINQIVIHSFVVKK